MAARFGELVRRFSPSPARLPRSACHKRGTLNPVAYAHWEPEIRNYGGTYGSNPGFDASQYPSEEDGIGRRHKKGAVILAFDGHVHFIRFEEFQREQRQNKPGLLWCVPDSVNGQ